MSSAALAPFLLHATVVTKVGNGLWQLWQGNRQEGVGQLAGAAAIIAESIGATKASVSITESLAGRVSTSFKVRSCTEQESRRILTLDQNQQKALQWLCQESQTVRSPSAVDRIMPELDELTRSEDTAVNIPYQPQRVSEIQELWNTRSQDLGFMRAQASMVAAVDGSVLAPLYQEVHVSVPGGSPVRLSFAGLLEPHGTGTRAADWLQDNFVNTFVEEVARVIQAFPDYDLNTHIWNGIHQTFVKLQIGFLAKYDNIRPHPADPRVIDQGASACFVMECGGGIWISTVGQMEPIIVKKGVAYRCKPTKYASIFGGAAAPVDVKCAPSISYLPKSFFSPDSVLFVLSSNITRLVPHEASRVELLQQVVSKADASKSFAEPLACSLRGFMPRIQPGDVDGFLPFGALTVSFVEPVSAAEEEVKRDEGPVALPTVGLFSSAVLVDDDFLPVEAAAAPEASSSSAAAAAGAASPQERAEDARSQASSAMAPLSSLHLVSAESESGTMGRAHTDSEAVPSLASTPSKRDVRLMRNAQPNLSLEEEERDDLSVASSRSGFMVLSRDRPQAAASGSSSAAAAALAGQILGIPASGSAQGKDLPSAARSNGASGAAAARPLRRGPGSSSSTDSESGWVVAGSAKSAGEESSEISMANIQIPPLDSSEAGSAVFVRMTGDGVLDDKSEAGSAGAESFKTARGTSTASLPRVPSVSGLSVSSFGSLAMPTRPSPLPGTTGAASSTSSAAAAAGAAPARKGWWPFGS